MESLYIKWGNVLQTLADIYAEDMEIGWQGFVEGFERAEKELAEFLVRYHGV